MIETMNMNECAAYLRAHGVSISNESLGNGLEKGVFSFGTAFRGPGGSRVTLIFKKLLDEWIAERETDEQ